MLAHGFRHNPRARLATRVSSTCLRISSASRAASTVLSSPRAISRQFRLSLVNYDTDRYLQCVKYVLSYQSANRLNDSTSAKSGPPLPRTIKNAAQKHVSPAAQKQTLNILLACDTTRIAASKLSAIAIAQHLYAISCPARRYSNKKKIQGQATCLGLALGAPRFLNVKMSGDSTFTP